VVEVSAFGGEFSSGYFDFGMSFGKRTAEAQRTQREERKR
jgi:hypothetical protein